MHHRTRRVTNHSSEQPHGHGWKRLLSSVMKSCAPAMATGMTTPSVVLMGSSNTNPEPCARESH